MLTGLLRVVINISCPQSVFAVLVVNGSRFIPLMQLRHGITAGQVLMSQHMQPATLQLPTEFSELICTVHGPRGQVQ